MAYQPKYAQKGKKPQKPSRPVREEQQPRKVDQWEANQPVEREEKTPRKRSTLGVVLYVLLGCIVVPVSCIAAGLIFKEMIFMVGRPSESAQSKTADMSIVEDIGAYVSGQVAAAESALLASQSPDTPESSGEIPGETIPKETEPVRKDYVIEEGTQVAPEPNQACYGESTDLLELLQVLDDAEWMLEGQKLYFDPKVELFEGSTVKYYLDDSIFAITWKEVHDGSVYTFSEIKVRHPSQFRRHLAGGEYGSDYQYKTTEMAASVNAVVASSGDFYRFRDFGAVVYEGEAKRVEGTYAETCYIDANGDMLFTYGGDVLTVQEVQDFVDENDIQFSLAFGPILVDNYELVEHTWYGVGEITEGYARAALCQLGNLHYIVVTANTEGPYGDIPTVAQFQKNIAATGCKMAYCLDGGQTAAIVMNDALINRPVYGEQRKISDIIYFATAVPEGG